MKKQKAYLRIYEQMRGSIINGGYPAGTKLPSKRFLAEEKGVSTVTVEHAYALLSDEGYIEARERSGYYVIFTREDGFASSPNRKPQRQSLEETEHGRFPLSVLSRTMRRVISERDEDMLSRSPGRGHPELRDAIAGYLYRNRGIFVRADQIVIGSGAEYLYGLLVELLGRERIFGIESPSYEKIEKVYMASGVDCRLLPLGVDGIDSSALFSTDADVLHITPYRSFPTGISASATKRHEYLRWGSLCDRVIIEDDFESEFSISSKPEETLFSLSGGIGVIYMNTFSKTVSPALRIGYMVLPDGLSSEFDRRLGFYSCTVPTFEQLVLSELISSGDFERHINRIRRQKRRLLLDKKKR